MTYVNLLCLNHVGTKICLEHSYYLQQKEEADFALIFMDTGGYLNMCGHNTIAAVTAAVETGMVDVEEGATEKEVVVETPAGLIYATAKLKDNGAKVKEVSFKKC